MPGMTNYHIGAHGTTLGHYGITWDYHTGLSEIIRPNLFKHSLIVTDSNSKRCVPGAAITAE